MFNKLVETDSKIHHCDITIFKNLNKIHGVKYSSLQCLSGELVIKQVPSQFWGWGLSVCISNRLWDGADTLIHKLLCVWQSFAGQLFEIPGKKHISLLCQMKQGFFRFHQLETGKVTASCTRNRSRLKVRFWRLEVGFRWSNNYANIPEHLPLGFRIGPGIFPQLLTTLKIRI